MRPGVKLWSGGLEVREEREVARCPPAKPTPTAAQQQQVVLLRVGGWWLSYQTGSQTSMDDSWMCGKKNQKRTRNTGNRKSES